MRQISECEALRVGGAGNPSEGVHADISRFRGRVRRRRRERIRGARGADHGIDAWLAARQPRAFARRCVRVDQDAADGPMWKSLSPFCGYLVAVGYLDPGNWATSLGWRLEFGCYALLSHRRPPTSWRSSSRCSAPGSAWRPAWRKPAATSSAPRLALGGGRLTAPSPGQAHRDGDRPQSPFGNLVDGVILTALDALLILGTSRLPSSRRSSSPCRRSSQSASAWPIQIGAKRLRDG